jgi:hypothetical protein
MISNKIEDIITVSFNNPLFLFVSIGALQAYGGPLLFSKQSQVIGHKSQVAVFNLRLLTCDL